jgi:hypothetical protein
VVAGLTALVPLAVAGRADAALLPTFTLSQATSLLSGQRITVSWANQLVTGADGALAVFECAGPFDPADYYRNCDELALSPARRSGSVDVTVHRQMIPDDLTLHVCRGLVGEQCSVVLVSAQTLAVHGSQPITFLPLASK